MSKKKSNPKKPKVHKELEGFEININEYGEIISNISIDKINDFLNRHVDDKKLREREDEELDDFDEMGEDDLSLEEDMDADDDVGEED
ncbi:MAG: hypothetical protein KDD49_09540 [Bacteroidetes bacterium]|nr:hypothetical protein [Bacteroidota bacterium]MCB9043320.1 hypothetical protein [Chitinophagales bacterium]